MYMRFDSVHQTMSNHAGGTPQPISPHHKGDEKIGTWPGLSESTGLKYHASHGMYFCGDALTGMLL